MFSTVAGGFEFSKQLGRPVGPGQANWMASAYSSVVSCHIISFSVFERRKADGHLPTQAHTECLRPDQRSTRRHIRTPEADAARRGHHRPLLHSECLLHDIRLLRCRTSPHRSWRRHTDAQRCGHPDHPGPSRERAEYHPRYICSFTAHRCLDRGDDCGGLPPVFAVEVAFYLPVSMASVAEREFQGRATKLHAAHASALLFLVGYSWPCLAKSQSTREVALTTSAQSLA